MIHLLLLNIAEENVTSVIRELKNSNIEADTLSLGNKDELTQDVINHSYWDAIILSEQSSEHYPLLTTAKKTFPNTPIIFISEDFSSQQFTEVMKIGVKDCIPASNIYKLPFRLRREISNETFISSDLNIKESAKTLSDIINLSTDDILLFDTQQFRCCFANNTAIGSLAYSHQELNNVTASDIFWEYDTDAFSNFIQPILQDKRKKIVFCTNIRRKTGVIYPAEVRFKKVIHQNSTYLLAINKDISDAWFKVRKLRRQRSLTNNYISKHEQKQELLANAAHDMRTSLQSIILSNKLLFDKQSGDFQQGFNKFQKAIHFSGKHLLNYINEFFDPNTKNGKTNISNLESDTLDLHSFIQKLFLVFKPIAQRNDIAFHFDKSKLNHSYISTNQTYVKRILKNLLSNAFKFTNEGSVTFESYSLSTDDIPATKLETKNAVAFRITDTGIGIPKEQQQKIFSRHQRTKNTKKGSGLGLHICQKLTYTLGGEIQVESKAGKGSTFTLYLPANEVKTSSSSNGHQTNGHKKAIPDQNKTILIIDDSEIHNLAIKEYLQYTFEKCVTANTLSEAKKLLRDTKVDCIVSDYIIKDQNCISFLKTTDSNKCFDIPTIVYTGKKLSEQERTDILTHAEIIIRKNAGSYETLTNTIISFFRNKQITNSSAEG